MKKILPLTLSFCGAALLIGSLVAAKDVPPPAPAPMAAAPKPGPGGPMERRLSERLGLTDEQQKKLEAIRGEIMRRRHDRQEQMGFAGPRRGGGQPGFSPGPQQGFGFAQQQGPQGPQGRRPAGPMEMIQQGNRMAAEGQRQLARQLGLSEEQSARLRDLARQHEEKAQAMQKEFRDQMLSVLTPEQQARVKEMHERRGPDGNRPDRGPGRPGPAPDLPPPGK